MSPGLGNRETPIIPEALLTVPSNTSFAAATDIIKSCFLGEASGSISLIRILRHFYIPHGCENWNEDDPPTLQVKSFLCSTFYVLLIQGRPHVRQKG